MKSRSIFSTAVFCIAVLFAGNLFAETFLYVIPNQRASDIYKYEVDGVELVTPADSLNGAGGDGVGLGCDPEIGLLFLTAEESGSIQISDMNTMTYIKTITVPGAGDLAGIVADVDKKRVYVMDRYTNHLYVLLWRGGDEFVFLYPDPYYIELENIETEDPYDGAFGIALDEENDLLYVADNTTDVKYYSTATWANDPNDHVTVGHDAISVAVDSPNQYLYTGSIYEYAGGGSNYLRQYHLGRDTESSIDVDDTVTGLTVDQATSRIYLATYDDNEVLIFDVVETGNDPNMVKIGPDPTLTLAKPSGMVVTNGEYYKSENIGVTLDDGMNNAPNLCVSPDDYFTYTVTIDPDGTDHSNVEVTLYLSVEVTYDAVDWDTMTVDPNYNEDERSYRWDNIDELPASGGVRTLSLEVKVTGYAEPDSELSVFVIARSDTAVRLAIENTPVCCWSADGADPNVVYVDSNAPGYNTGTSWADAYTDLQDAIDRINGGCPASDAVEIWVAEGTYKPGSETDDSFVIPDGVEVYGGYAGYGAGDPDERNTSKYETILTGEPSGAERNDTVITMGADTLLDGFTVTDALKYGIYADNSDFMIEICNIENNEEYGIYASGGDAIVKWCKVINSGRYGIFHEGEDKRLTIENSQIKWNDQHGIYTRNSIPTVKNSIISSNGSIGQSFYGIRIINPSNNPTLHNNTIVYNAIEGISFVDNEGSDWPDIQNCIIWFNNDGDEVSLQMAGLDPNQTYYNCIHDPYGDPNGVDTTADNEGNITCLPGFAYTIDPNNFHLAYDSPCVDSGNPNLSYTDQLDFDGEDRVYIYEGVVDIGADEVYSCDEPLSEDDIYNALDWNADGLVNLEEFYYFSEAWLSRDPDGPDPGDPNDWNPVCNMDTSGDSEYEIDMADLTEFIGNGYWLWTACWKQSNMDMVESMMMAMGGGESMMMPMTMEYSTPVMIEQETPTLEEQAAQLLKTLDWLDEIWLDPSVQEAIDEEDWLDFVESIEELLIDILEQQEE